MESQFQTFALHLGDKLHDCHQDSGNQGLVNIAVLDYVAENIREGMTTEEIDRLVESKTRQLGGIPAPLGYEGYPKSVCTSVNHEVCHGIPSEAVVLKSGDIVNVDVSTIYKGYYSDSSRMFRIGRVEGRGITELFDLRGKVDILTGTLGKAFGGAVGGFTTGRKEVTGS